MYQSRAERNRIQTGRMNVSFFFLLIECKNEIRREGMKRMKTCVCLPRASDTHTKRFEGKTKWIDPLFLLLSVNVIRNWEERGEWKMGMKMRGGRSFSFIHPFYLLFYSSLSPSLFFLFSFKKYFERSTKSNHILKTINKKWPPHFFTRWGRSRRWPLFVDHLKYFFHPVMIIMIPLLSLSLEHFSPLRYFTFLHPLLFSSLLSLSSLFLYDTHFGY